MNYCFRRVVLRIELVYQSAIFVKMRVTGQYRNDAMLRQIAEAVRINNSNVDNRINNKAEWNLVLFPTVRVDNGGTD